MTFEQGGNKQRQGSRVSVNLLLAEEIRTSVSVVANFAPQVQERLLLLFDAEG